MAHFWVETDEGWGILPLNQERLVLAPDRESPVRRQRDDEVTEEQALLVPYRNGNKEEWAVIPRAGRNRVLVNGYPVVALHVLRHKDQIHLKGTPRILYSSETLPEVQPYPEGLDPVRCGLCTRPIHEGQMVVRCPSCRTYFHEAETASGGSLHCWTYAEHCRVCHTSTALERSYEWTPEDL